MWRIALLALFLAVPSADAQLGLPAGQGQLFPHLSAPVTCAPFETFAAAPYENFATPPYQTGC